MNKYCTVTELNQYIRDLLARNEVVNGIMVAGEISDFKRYPSSGHCYFSLKDEQCTVRAVMFKSYADLVKFEVRDGISVAVMCSATIYPKSGSYQLNVTQMLEIGIGERAKRLEKLKRTMEAEGLFSPERRKPIPTMPSTVAVITSANGAAIRDIISVAERRWPSIRIILIDSAVQGVESEQGLLIALGALDSLGADVAIVGRGGGSADDLQVFDSESIARAASRCTTPIISAVGHETDISLLDLVSDKRAATPTAAAELALPDVREYVSTIVSHINDITERSTRVFAGKEALLDSIRSSVATRVSDKLKGFESRIGELVRIAEAYNKDSIIKRGYAVVRDAENTPITRLKSLTFNRISVEFHDGVAYCEVIERKENGNQ